MKLTLKQKEIIDTYISGILMPEGFPSPFWGEEQRKFVNGLTQEDIPQYYMNRIIELSYYETIYLDIDIYLADVCLLIIINRTGY